MRHGEGQSLVEVLIGVAVGAVFIVGAVAAIVPSLTTNKNVVLVQERTEAAQGLADNVRAWAAGNWNNVLALATSTSCAPVSKVQGGNIDNSGVGGTPAITFSNDHASDTIIVAMMFDTTTTVDLSFNDTEGNTYQKAIENTADFCHEVGNYQVFYAYNIKGSSANTITASTSFNGRWGMIADEWSGLQTGNNLDQTSTLTTVTYGSDMDSGYTPQTTYPEELLYGFGGVGNCGSGQPFTAGPGYTLQEEIWRAAAESSVASTIGSYHATMVGANGTGYWLMTLSTYKGLGNHYHLLTDQSPFAAIAGDDSIALGSTTFSRYFCVENAYRDSGGNVTTTASGNSYDPSTMFVTVNASASSTYAPSTETSLQFYVTRNGSNNFTQTSWSGGSGQSSPLTLVSGAYNTSTNVSASATITLAPQASTGGACSASQSASWSNGYTYRREITVDNTKVSTVNGTTLTNFPVLVSGTYSSLATTGNGGHVQNANGYDIIFTADGAGQYPLSFEEESYSSSTGAINYWVKLPTLSATTTVSLYMFYGNSSITASQAAPTAVWDGNYMAVWHLPNGTTLSANDSTVNADNGTASGTTATTGEIDGAAAFNGSNNYITAPTISIPTAVTAEAWVYSANFSQDGAVLEKANVNTQWELFFQPSKLYWRGGGSDSNTTCNDPSNSSWHFVVGTQSGTTTALYIDGVQCKSASSTAIGNGSGNVEIGRFSNSSWYFNGSIDEARVSNVARSADWISTEYNSESSPSTFYTMGSEQTSS